jgi:hypothetical protein
MDQVNDDLEQRFAVAAEELREYLLTENRSAELKARMSGLERELASLQAQQAQEHHDVERLANLSITSVLAALRGSRRESLEREQAEADAARFRVAEAGARLDAVRREHSAAQARLVELAAAPARYQALIVEKEQALLTSVDPRGRRLLELAEERGRLLSETRELTQAARAARQAGLALGQVRSKLTSAGTWSTYDTFLGGGMIASAIKHERLDDAARAAAVADQQLTILRTELADVAGLPVTTPALAIRDTTRFFDVWFDNIFTDLTVRDHIAQAQKRIAAATARVQQVESQLTARLTASNARLAEIETERMRLLSTLHRTGRSNPSIE